ncbi:carboxylesterase family protein [Actinoplanes sp. NBRC 103695]|uniref:carboxylesterase/lipase family protein n=1 Tax=Actinoplanes sp. NBRC 103695 TaxID=3032202 RepID=UPI0024A47857|nr:carboxylesterase family protein [Actinoplanes sp. NBRC 103695]GLY94089.1 carboxylic ester hydrolase [Actinoplanes sp. NBRC 103695]
MELFATTRAGRIQGRLSSAGVAFLGIPYAASPFGPNRMRPPRPVTAWEGTRRATAYGPTVPKGTYPPPYRPYFPEVDNPGAECLNLNVWTPDPTASGLPVLVWIHGGSFTNGSGSVSGYDGSAFARDGVVCVTINYRLAAEGFLYLLDGSPNLGLQDQVAALHWVQENIAAFGGDPARVTVAGESAGAMSAVTLLSMPATKGLFARAIAQSGAAANTLTAEQGLLVSGHLADALGVAPTRDAIADVPLNRLVSAASDLVTEVQTAPDPAKWGAIAASQTPFAPVIDHGVLEDAPLESLRHGVGAQVPLLIGFNRDEARLFLIAPGTWQSIDDSMLANAASGYGLTPAQTAIYRANRPGASAGDVLSAIATDWFFGIPVQRVAEARHGNTWVYRFDHPEPAANGGLGACHGAEVPFVFDTVDEPDARPLIGDDPSRTVADTTHGLWVSFISGSAPGWAPYLISDRTIALIADRIDEVRDPAPDEWRVWNGIR